jgi:hypothetical protein
MALVETSSYANGTLDVGAAVGGTYYIRKDTNRVNATSDDAVDLGTLTENTTALRASSTIKRGNTTDYYKFNLDGDNMKLSLSNLSTAGSLRVQILNSSGKVVADNYGTTTQQEAYASLTSSDGYDTDAGEYTVKVTYGGTETRSIAQSYSVCLYSGSQFRDMYATSAAVQTDPDKTVETDTTRTFSTSDAEEYSTTAYNQVNATALTAIQIGWLLENKTALSLTSQLTTIDDENYYSFTFQQGSAVKLAFNNETDTSDLRIQILDSSGSYVYADSEGTEDQQAAYESMLSSDGLTLDDGATYVVKVTYARDADKTKAQTYNFKLYSGDYYNELDVTTASAQTFDNANLSGTWDTSYSQSSYLASMLYAESQGSSSDDALSIISTSF